MKNKVFIFAQISIISLASCVHNPNVKNETISRISDTKITSYIPNDLDWIAAELAKKQYSNFLNEWPNMMLSIGNFQSSFNVNVVSNNTDIVENYLKNISIKQDVRLRGEL